MSAYVQAVLYPQAQTYVKGIRNGLSIKAIDQTSIVQRLSAKSRQKNKDVQIM